MNSEELQGLVSQAEQALNTIKGAFEHREKSSSQVDELRNQLKALGAEKDEISKSFSNEKERLETEKANAIARSEKLVGRLERHKQVNEQLSQASSKADERYNALLEQRKADLNDVDAILSRLTPLIEGQ